MDEAGRQGLVKFMIMRLTGGGQGCQGTPMETVFQRHNDVTVRSLGFGGPFPGHLDGTFIGLCAGIAEENAGKAGARTQRFSQPGTGSRVIQVGHVLDLTDLFFHGRNPDLICYTKGSNRNSGAHIDIFLSGSIPDKGAFAGNNFHGKALIGMGDICLIKFNGCHGRYALLSVQIIGGIIPSRTGGHHTSGQPRRNVCRHLRP